MNTEYYNELLSQAINFFVTKGAIYFCGIALIYFVGWLLHKKKGVKWEFDTKKILIAIGAFAITCIMVGINAIPAALDRNAEDYVEVHGTYIRYSEGTNYRNYITHGYVDVKPDDQNHTINLNLSTKNYTTEFFPLGEHEGTVIYARKSKIALEFIPDT